MWDAAKRSEVTEIANTLVLDLMIGLRSLDIFNAIHKTQPLSANMRVGLGRLSTTHLILALAKWQEFYKRYKGVIPHGLSSAAKNAYKELERRGIREFRNKVVGHIWDDELNRPLLAEEIQRRLAKVLEPDEETFHRWIYDPVAADKGDHLVGLTEKIRDELPKAASNQTPSADR